MSQNNLFLFAGLGALAFWFFGSKAADSAAAAAATASKEPKESEPKGKPAAKEAAVNKSDEKEAVPLTVGGQVMNTVKV